MKDLSTLTEKVILALGFLWSSSVKCHSNNVSFEQYVLAAGVQEMLVRRDFHYQGIDCAMIWFVVCVNKSHKLWELLDKDLLAIDL